MLQFGIRISKMLFPEFQFHRRDPIYNFDRITLNVSYIIYDGFHKILKNDPLIPDQGSP